jgi:hypothetical protein
MPHPVDASIIGEREKILLYGAGGVGKTFTAGTMPGNVFFIVFGGPNEVKTLMSPDFRGKHPEKEGKLFYDFTTEPLGKRGHFKSADAYDQACDLLDEALRLEEKGDFAFDSLVIDSATGLRRFAMNKAMEVNFHRATSGTTKTALARLRDENIIIPGDNDWMSEMSLTTQFMDWVFRMDKHVCVCTHVWETKKRDRASGETIISDQKPLFTGKNREEIPTMFDNVWYVSSISKGRGIIAQLQTVGDNTTSAKTRMGGALAPVERDPDLTKIIKKLQKAAVKK